MAFSQNEISDLPWLLSAPRFETYLAAMGRDPARALALYAWNLDVSAAFFVPVHVLEVSLRNAVADVLNAVHGPRWPWSAGFRRSLPRPRRTTDYDPAQDLDRVSTRQPTSGKVIAELSLAFWQQLFTAGQQHRLWEPNFSIAFPGAPTGLGVAVKRAKIYQELAEIRRLRNRIAHHEPIFRRNLAGDYAAILEIVSWRNQTARDWLNQRQQVTILLGQRQSL